MNYSLKPYSDLRPIYSYKLDDLTDIDSNIMVTLLTPFFNSGPLIHDCAKSVFGQSLQLFQWVIVNDCSTDSTSLAELEKYRHYDPRITIIDLPKNQGLPGARNAGIQQAKGKCI